MPRNIPSIRVDGNIAYVPLTKGFEAIIDACDAVNVEGYRWWAMTNKRHNKVYAAGRIEINGVHALIFMHRFLLNAPHGLDVDHKNGDGLDNRRENIRLATRSQNMHNKKMQHNNTSGFKGVHWHKTHKKWCANIKVGDNRKFLGGFDRIEDAAWPVCDGYCLPVYEQCRNTRSACRYLGGPAAFRSR